MLMKYFVGFLVIVALILAGLFISSRNVSQSAETDEPKDESTSVPATGIEHIVVLTERGYEPTEITIKQGDRIVFSASSDYGRLHWPASNLHPTHSLYSEFDPLAPIEPEATWGFVFGKVGEWRFHDHLAPYHTGTITVQ